MFLESTATGVASTIGFQITETVNDHGAELPKKLATCGTTTLISTATGVIGVSINNHGIKEIHNKYANAYVESMSDEELETALVKMNLLVEEQEGKNTHKSI